MAWNGQRATIFEILLPARAEILFSCNRPNMASVSPAAVNDNRSLLTRRLWNQSVKLVIHLHLVPRLKIL